MFFEWKKYSFVQCKQIVRKTTKVEINSAHMLQQYRVFRQDLHIVW